MKKFGDLMNPSLIDSGPINSAVFHKAELLEAMTVSARSRLPENIAEHCWVGGYEKDRIVIVTDYPHYAIYMRCHQREILKQLKEEFSTYLPDGIRKVRIKVSRILAGN